MSTAANLAAEIGSTGTLRTDVNVAVKIKDVRVAYGRKDYLVTPVAGSGEAWVSADRVSDVEVATTATAAAASCYACEWGLRSHQHTCGR